MWRKRGNGLLEHIWNPWHGCKKYSEGCEHCYMYYLDAQRNRDGSEIYRVKTGFRLPLKRKRTGEYQIPAGSTVHVCMTSDFFLEEADPWRNEAWEIMRQRPDLHFWLQTKRAERVERCLPKNWGDGWKNVGLCFTAENQRRADERIPILLTLPFHIKSVMCAPMLGPITLAQYLETGQIGRVLVDGENYDGNRPLCYEWVRTLYEECLHAGVNFDFVGVGNHFIRDGKDYHVCRAYHRVTALRSGMQIPPCDTNIPIQRSCRSCPRRDVCGGCSRCGKCGK